MHTGIVSPRSAITRQCAAPTLCRCQCIASVRDPNCCTRYMPTLRMPRTGSREMTIGSVMYGPPSSGQQVMIGSFRKSTSSPRRITAWHGAGAPRKLAYLEQPGQQRELPHEALRHLELEQLRDACADGIEILDA